MKKFISIILSLVLVLSLATVASAATITITAPNADGTVSGETYTAYKVFSGSFSGENDANKVYTITTSDAFYTAVAASNLFVKTAVPGSTTEFYVTAAEGATVAEIAALLNGVIDKGTGLSSVYDSTAKTYTISGADEGYYLIVSSFGSGLIVDTVGHSNISVEPKNSYPSMTKKIVSGTDRVDEITADRGATITFEVVVTIPATAVGAITIHDDAADALTKITLIGNTVTKAETVTDGCDAEFVIDADTVAGNLGKTVTFQYTATLAGTAATATAHTNTAWLTYAGLTGTQDVVTVKTFEFDVFKYTEGEADEEGKTAENPLAGAGFILKNAIQGDADNGKYYSVSDGVVTWVDSIEAATVVTSGSDGYANFAGLANGTYTLIEKVVPAGYNKAADQTVTISNANLPKGTVKVLNSTGSELPSTGGIGTTIFYVVGCLLMTGAVVLLVTKRRMGNA